MHSLVNEVQSVARAISAELGAPARG